MGGSESKATVLECMIKNLKTGFGGDYGVKMMPNCLHMLCEVEWPPVGVGWPPENTMNLQIVEAVYTVVTGEPGFSNTTVQKHQFFGAQPSSQSNSHIHT